MKLNEWLDMEVGRAAKMAATFKRTASAVTQWRTNGVPVALMKDVRDFTKGEVTLDEMVPESQDSHGITVAPAQPDRRKFDLESEQVEGMQLESRRATEKAAAKTAGVL